MSLCLCFTYFRAKKKIQFCDLMITVCFLIHQSGRIDLQKVWDWGRLTGLTGLGAFSSVTECCLFIHSLKRQLQREGNPVHWLILRSYHNGPGQTGSPELPSRCLMQLARAQGLDGLPLPVLAHWVQVEQPVFEAGPRRQLDLLCLNPGSSKGIL